ncbi:MAG: glycosyltransferase [Planctomycetes bacterium]|nr:glycosyltransferase [Planctomycetota bacterium]
MSGYRILYHHRIRADDGQAVHVRELIGALRAEGHEVLECALVAKSGAAQAGGGAAGTGWLRHLRLPRLLTEALEIVYGTAGARRVVAAGRSFRPHFVYERCALHCRVGLLAARALGVPLLLEVNSPHVDEMRALGLLRFAARARASERMVLAGADRVLAVTRVLADLLVARGARAETVRVIPNGAEPDRYGPEAGAASRTLRAGLRLPGEAFLLGFVGYLRPWHRLDLVLEAMRRPGLEALHLVLIGDGPALRPTLAAAGSAGLAGRVHALGRVPPADLPPRVAMCDALLVPAINAYASPLKLFDALAAGVAAVAPRQPNLEEVLRDGEDGVLFPPGDAAGLAERLRWLVDDRTRAVRLGAAGRASLLAHEWTWRGNARRVVRAFEEVAQ